MFSSLFLSNFLKISNSISYTFVIPRSYYVSNFKGPGFSGFLTHNAPVSSICFRCWLYLPFSVWLETKQLCKISLKILEIKRNSKMSLPFQELTLTPFVENGLNFAILKWSGIVPESISRNMLIRNLLKSCLIFNILSGWY